MCSSASLRALAGFLALVSLWSSLVAAQEHKTAAEPNTAAGTKPEAPAPLLAAGQAIRDVEYAQVGDKSLKLDLYGGKTLKGVKPPLVIWIHGGAWRAGSKDGCPIVWLNDLGYTVASIQYRLSGVAKFPAQIHDCKGAVRWLRANADKYGYDATRIAASGASAGGHLAALLGTSAEMKELEGDIGGNAGVSSRVQAVVDLFGPTDMEYYIIMARGEVDQPASPIYQLLGGKPSQHVGLARLASPAGQVTKDDAPILILHGDKDPTVNHTQSMLLNDAYRKAGVESTFELIAGAAHGGPQFEDDARKKLVRDFLAKHLRTPPAVNPSAPPAGTTPAPRQP